MVRESVKRLSEEEQQLYIDLDATEEIFYKLKSKRAKEAVNRLRYILIIQLHELKGREF